MNNGKIVRKKILSTLGLLWSLHYWFLLGIEMVGIHVGIGVGVSVRGDATVVYSIEHGKVGWNEPHTPPSKVLEKRE